MISAIFSTRYLSPGTVVIKLDLHWRPFRCDSISRNTSYLQVIHSFFPLLIYSLTNRVQISNLLTSPLIQIEPECHLYNNGERVRMYVCMYVCVLLIFFVGSRTGRTLIFGILGALTL